MRTTGSEKGYTMLETIMYIGILGTLGAILASYASEVFGRYKTGRIAQQILDLKKARRQNRIRPRRRRFR